MLKEYQDFVNNVVNTAIEKQSLEQEKFNHKLEQNQQLIINYIRKQEESQNNNFQNNNQQQNTQSRNP